MNKDMLRAFFYFFSANFQAVCLIALAFWGEKRLEECCPIGVAWKYVVWPVCLLAIGHSFYLVIRRVLDIGKRKGGLK